EVRFSSDFGSFLTMMDSSSEPVSIEGLERMLFLACSFTKRAAAPVAPTHARMAPGPPNSRSASPSSRRPLTSKRTLSAIVQSGLGQHHHLHVRGIHVGEVCDVVNPVAAAQPIHRRQRGLQRRITQPDAGIRIGTDFEVANVALA